MVPGPAMVLVVLADRGTDEAGVGMERRVCQLPQPHSEQGAEPELRATGCAGSLPPSDECPRYLDPLASIPGNAEGEEKPFGLPEPPEMLLTL